MKIEQLTQLINEDKLTPQFKALYTDSVDLHKQRYQQLLNEFTQNFNSIGDIMLFSAPGRTEIAGNHTDHQCGQVIAGAVSLDIIAAVELNNEHVIRIKSKGHDLCEVKLSELDKVEDEQGSSTSLVRGIANEITKMGHTLRGFNAYTTSMVLRGSGLSSSAAFEVLTANIINHICCNNTLTPLEQAQISQRAENIYYNKPCGLMDQTACSIGGVIAIDFLNPKAPKIDSIDFDLNKYGYKLVIVNTKGSHGDLTDDYAAVPAEMKAIAGYFHKQHLREVDENEFFSNIGKIRVITGDRAVMRAIHFFAENNRIANITNSLNQGEIEQFFSLIKQSGLSSNTYLQNIYATKSPQAQGINIALAVTERFVGEIGAYRVHGGGFAGTIQAYIKADKVNSYIKEIENIFGDNSCYIVNLRKYGAIKLDLKQ